MPLPLPAKRTFGNLQPGFVEERRLALERYLQRCLSVAEIGSCATFSHFVESDLEAADERAAQVCAKDEAALREAKKRRRKEVVERQESQADQHGQLC